MATIRKVVRSEGLATPGAPSVSIKSYVGQALEGLGSAVASLEGLADARNRQATAKAEFQTANDYRVMNARLGEQFGELQATTPEDGAGLHDTFMDQVYRPARDAFLAKVPEKLREKYGVMLADPGPDGAGEGEDTAGWSIKAATAEKDKLYGWYGTQIGQQNEQLANAITIDPGSYDKLLKQGMDGIDASGLPETQKQEQRREWERMAQIAHLGRMLEINPAKVLTDLKADPRLLPLDAQVALVEGALIRQESGGRPGAISNKGAAGLMQIMPGTAKEIAHDLGDKNFNQAWRTGQIQQYLTNPTVNRIYGRHYLKKMLVKYGPKGGIEAALVAYNGGPRRAEAWIKSGFDDSVLPKETRDYYKAIMGGASMPSFRDTQGGEVEVANVEFVFANQRDVATLDKVNPAVLERVKTSFGGLGIGKVKINDAFREAPTGKSAKHSQHLEGNALDIDVSGYTHAQRVQIIQALSANGITGIGVGNNIIHADVGGRRAWGYHSDGSANAPVPAWAQKAIDAHLQGKSVAPVGQKGGRYASLPYDDRKGFIEKAGNILLDKGIAGNKFTEVQKQEVRSAMATDISNVELSGAGTPGFDPTSVSTVLGEDDYMRYMAKRDEALRTYRGALGMETMSAEQMEERLQEYDPGDVPSDTRDADERVFDKLSKKRDRIEKLRANDPVSAARLFPDVEEAYNAATGTNDPVAIQKFIELNIARQGEFNLKPEAIQPIPKEWALDIGRRFLKDIPEMGVVDGKSNRQAVRALIVTQYDAMQKIFGDYTDEVIKHSLVEYHGVGENTAKTLTAAMDIIQKGGDPFRTWRKQVDKALDMDDMEQLAEPPSMWQDFKQGISNWFAGEDTAAQDSADAPDNGITEEPRIPLRSNPEKVRRARDELNDVEGEIDAATEERLIRKYGQENYDAARNQAGAQ